MGKKKSTKAQPIFVTWDNFTEADVSLIRQKQKEIFESIK